MREFLVFLILHKVVVADDFAADIKIADFACGKMPTVCTGSFTVAAGIACAGFWHILTAVFGYLCIGFACWFHKNRSFQILAAFAASYFLGQE